MFMRSLKLQNILSFREPEPLELRPLNILIGANASGKSNLIDCIELLQALPGSLNNYISRRGGIESWIWKGRNRADEAARISCTFELGDQRLEYFISLGSLEHLPAIEQETLGPSVSAGDPALSLTRLSNVIAIGERTIPGSSIARNESVLAAYRNPLDPNPVTRSARAFADIRVYTGFKTGPNDQARTGVSSSGPKYPIDDTGSNLALVLQEMDFHGSLKTVKQWLNRLSDRFEDIKIRAEGGISQVYLEERGIGRVPATRLSDGTLKFLCLMAVLFDHASPPLVCIEEPETGLHPDAVSIVADALREASRRMQLIVTTHSDALVDRFSDEPENIVVCDRDFDEGTRFQRLSATKLKEWLEDYSLGELWKRGEIGGTQR